LGSGVYAHGADYEPIQKEQVESILEANRLFFIKNRPFTSLKEYGVLLVKTSDGFYTDTTKRVTVFHLTELEYDIMILDGDNLDLRKALLLEKFKSIHITFSINNKNQISFITIRFGITKGRLRYTNYIIYNGETDKYDYKYCSQNSEECTSLYISILHNR
jgi:hypothetical protein